MDKGAFQTSRKLFDSPLWNDITKFRIFFYIYGNAVFSKDGVNIGGIKVKRGQFLRSFKNISKDLTFVKNGGIKEYGTGVISRKVKELVKENRLLTSETDFGTLFTVVNYDKYQDLNNYKKFYMEHDWDTFGTILEQPRNNNKNVKKDNNELIEEEDILKGALKNNKYQQLSSLLKRHNINQIFINKTIIELAKRNIDSFSINLVDKQIKHMIVKETNGERIYDFPSYFTNGLIRILGQENLIKNYPQEERVERDTSFYYNWLDQ